jgi:hypothetical protein
MKMLFNILLFLAVFAFTAEIASALWEKTKVESLAKADSDEEDSDSDVPDGSEEEEEEDCRAKGWFFAGMEIIELEWINTFDRKHFAELGNFPELHLTNPPYSPPELV